LTGISSPSTWQFTTKSAGPDPSTATNIVVAGDGSGDFVTVQGAIDWVPRETPRRSHSVAQRHLRGNQPDPAGKNNLTFIGEGWQESVIAYANTIPFQLANARQPLPQMFFAVGNDLVFKNFVFTNSTPQGRLASRGFAASRDCASSWITATGEFPDTLLITRQIPVPVTSTSRFIQGDVDFILGQRHWILQSCEIRAMLRAAARKHQYPAGHSAGVYGLIFTIATSPGRARP